MRFCVFDSIKTRFADPDTGTFSTIGNILAGMASGIVASTTVVTPSERIKTALIDDARSLQRFKSPLQACSMIVQEQGVLGLYRGYVGTTLKQIGATAFRLGTFNIIKDLYRKHNVKQTSVLDFATGAMSGLITTLATQPFDVIKTRSQTATGSSTMNACREVLKDEGVRGFWKGTALRLGRTVFSGAILFTVYEQMTRLLTSAETSRNDTTQVDMVETALD
jgi:solute carrier family 25 (mitochondrial citrate transporter), member 1